MDTSSGECNSFSLAVTISLLAAPRILLQLFSSSPDGSSSSALSQFSDQNSRSNRENWDLGLQSRITMDVWPLNLKGGGIVWGVNKKQEKGLGAVRQSSRLRAFGRDDWNGLEIRISARRWRRSSSANRSLVVRAAGKKKKDENPSSSGDNNPIIPEGDDSKGSSNPAHDKSKLGNSTHKFLHTLFDWRDFRANLVAREQVDSAPPLDESSHEPSDRPGLKWAHPISMPETGCVLVATEKLDGVQSFERTVVLLLRLGSRDPKEGPFGVIINRPYQKKINQIKSSNTDLVTTFGDCPLHYGGPLEASMFLLKTSRSPLPPGFEQVVPGICFGARNNLDEAAELVKKGSVRAQDFRFLVGYAGWQLDQLRDEIESEYWVVAACSSYLIGGGSGDSSGLWEEILQLMGGRYSELSRKPKQDSS